MSKQTFINSIVPGAKSAHKKFGVLASITIAQAILESGWGKKALGNNLFGIKWTPTCGHQKQIFRTKEFENGEYITKDLAFRKYKSLDESIIDHAELLCKSRYAPVRAAKTFEEACCQLQRCGYATDPQYAELLTKIIKQNKLYLFDK